MRASGLLLPVFSLPGKYGIGCFSDEAYRFVDFVKEAGQKYWQILPVGPTGYGDSPYQSFSAFAGNPYFISPDTLVREGLLTEEEGNLINVEGKTSKGLFYNSKADVTYGAEYTVTLKSVYTVDENEQRHAYPTNKFEYADGVITLKADDGILLNSVFAEVEYTLTHNFNYGKTDVKTVVIEFQPAGADEYSL